MSPKLQARLEQLKATISDQFLDEPMLNIDDLIQTAAKRQGVINILAADRLMSWLSG